MKLASRGQVRGPGPSAMLDGGTKWRSAHFVADSFDCEADGMGDSGKITLERRGHRGRYVLPMPDGDEAELTFVDSGPGRVVVDHSWVPPRHRGKGVALELVERAVADARAAGVKITPLCRYVAAEFRRHPHWSDVLQT